MRGIFAQHPERCLLAPERKPFISRAVEFQVTKFVIFGVTFLYMDEGTALFNPIMGLVWNCTSCPGLFPSSMKLKDHLDYQLQNEYRLPENDVHKANIDAIRNLRDAQKKQLKDSIHPVCLLFLLSKL